MTPNGGLMLALGAWIFFVCLVSSALSDSEIHIAVTWGSNLEGQLGLGETDAMKAAVNSPTEVEALGEAQISKVAAGGEHTVFLLEQGEVYACGENTYGQLGIGALPDGTIIAEARTPTKVSLHTHEVIDVQAGYYHSLALLKDNSVYAWGLNENGQLGVGNYGLETGLHVPTYIDGLKGKKVVTIATGGFHSLAVTDTGDLYVWGMNTAGQLGLGHSLDKIFPVLHPAFIGVSPIMSLAAGYQHSVALLKNGTVAAWGLNDGGQLGVGLPLPDDDIHVRSPILTDISSIGDNILSVDAGGFHSAVVTETGDLHIWGWNDKGQLGLGDRENRGVPSKVELNGIGVSMLALGYRHTIAVDNRSKFLSWGWNSYHQLGLGLQSKSDLSLPTELSLLTDRDVKFLAAGAKHSSIVAGDLKCFDVECPAPKACKQDGYCRFGECVYTDLDDNTPCDDGNLCTDGDICTAGVCISGEEIFCESPNQCHGPGVCDAATGVCTPQPLENGTPCDDGSLCTLTETCQDGVCVVEEIVECDPQTDCSSAGICNASTGECEYTRHPDGMGCDDQDECSENDVCFQGICKGDYIEGCGVADPCEGIDCTDPPLCHHVEGVCTDGVCYYKPLQDGSSCEDGDLCTTDDVCEFGECIGGDSVQCAVEHDTCHGEPVCDPSSGQCLQPVLEDGTACDDGNLCTFDDYCLHGSCVGAHSVTCPAPTGECQEIGQCAPETGECLYTTTPNGRSCDIGLCSVDGTCLDGECVDVSNRSCEKPDQCHEEGHCIEGQGCVFPEKEDGTQCDDGNSCTIDEKCEGGVCIATKHVGEEPECHSVQITLSFAQDPDVFIIERPYVFDDFCDILEFPREGLRFVDAQPGSHVLSSNPTGDHHHRHNILRNTDGEIQERALSSAYTTRVDVELTDTDGVASHSALERLLELARHHHPMLVHLRLISVIVDGEVAAQVEGVVYYDDALLNPAFMKSTSSGEGKVTYIIPAIILFVLLLVAIILLVKWRQSRKRGVVIVKQEAEIAGLKRRLVTETGDAALMSKLKLAEKERTLLQQDISDLELRLQRSLADNAQWRQKFEKIGENPEESKEYLDLTEQIKELERQKDMKIRDMNSLEQRIREEEKGIIDLEEERSTVEEQVKRLRGELEVESKVFIKGGGRDTPSRQSSARSMSSSSDKPDMVHEYMTKAVTSLYARLDPEVPRIPVTRIQHAIYQYGSRKLSVMVQNGGIVVRTGGGYTTFEEFVLTNADLEASRMARLDKMASEGGIRGSIIQDFYSSRASAGSISDSCRITRGSRGASAGSPSEARTASPPIPEDTASSPARSSPLAQSDKDNNKVKDKPEGQASPLLGKGREEDYFK